MRKMFAHAPAWVLWWVTLFWLWLLFSGDWNRIELVAAACAATVASTLAEAARGLTGTRFRIAPAAFSTVGPALLQVPVDFGILLLALGRAALRRERPAGTFVTRKARTEPPGDDPLAFGTRAWILYVANFSPNAYVIAVDEEEGAVLFHDLVRHRKSEEPA
jgi:hypothetical protein